MDLADGGAGQRLLVKALETVTTAEGPLKNRLKIGTRHGGEPVMELAQGPQVGFIKEIRPGCQHLGQLDETGPKTLHRRS